MLHFFVIHSAFVAALCGANVLHSPAGRIHEGGFTITRNAGNLLVQPGICIGDEPCTTDFNCNGVTGLSPTDNTSASYAGEGAEIYVSGAFANASDNHSISLVIDQLDYVGGHSKALHAEAELYNTLRLEVSGLTFPNDRYRLKLQFSVTGTVQVSGKAHYQVSAIATAQCASQTSGVPYACTGGGCSVPCSTYLASDWDGITNHETFSDSDEDDISGTGSEDLGFANYLGSVVTLDNSADIFMAGDEIRIGTKIRFDLSEGDTGLETFAVDPTDPITITIHIDIEELQSGTPCS